jgi:hypothetical protein
MIGDCLAWPDRKRVLLCCDPKDWLIVDLVHFLAVGRRVLLLPLPNWLLKYGFKLLGRPGIYHKMYGSLLIARTGAEMVRKL